MCTSRRGGRVRPCRAARCRAPRCSGRRDREQHRAADARARVRAVDPQRVALVLVPGLDVDVVRALVDRAGPHQVHAVAAGRRRVARIPERDRILERLRRQRNGREVVVRAALARDLAGRERVADDPERVLEPLPATRVHVAPEPRVLDRRDAAADAESRRPPVSWSSDAHVLDDPHRVVERQQLHHRAEPDRLRHLRGRRDEDLLVRAPCTARSRGARPDGSPRTRPRRRA